MASPKVPTPSSYALWSGPAAGHTANAGPSKPAAQEFPASALKEWVASHNLEISRTHPDREGSPWDYIGHRFPREKSPGTAVHSTIITEGRWAAEFKVLESKGNSGNGMYLGVTDGEASLTQEKGGRAWVLDLNEGKLRTFNDGFNIGCNGVGMSGRKLMRNDMKCVCKGAKIYFELDMRHRAFAVEAVPMGKSLAGSLTHARVELPSAVRLVIGIFQGHDAVQFVGLTRLPTDASDPPPPPAHQPQRQPGEKSSSLSRSNTSDAAPASASCSDATAFDEPEPLFQALGADEPLAPPGPRFVTDPGDSGAISPSELDDDQLSARDRDLGGDRDLPPHIGTPPDSPQHPAQPAQPPQAQPAQPPQPPQAQPPQPPQPPQAQPPQPNFGGGAAAAAPKRAAPAALPGEEGGERANKAARQGGLGDDAAAPAGRLPESLPPDDTLSARGGTPSPSEEEHDGPANGGAGAAYRSLSAEGAEGAGGMQGLGGDGEGSQVAMHEERMRCRRAELQELKSLLEARLVTDENYVNEVQRVLEKHQF